MKLGSQSSKFIPRAVRMSDGSFSAVAVSFQAADGKTYYALLSGPEFALRQVVEDEHLIAGLIEKRGFVPVPAHAPVLKPETLHDDLAALRAVLP